MNPRSLIQPSETLPIKLTGTHKKKKWNLVGKFYETNLGFFMNHEEIEIFYIYVFMRERERVGLGCNLETLSKI